MLSKLSNSFRCHLAVVRLGAMAMDVIHVPAVGLCFLLVSMREPSRAYLHQHPSLCMPLPNAAAPPRATPPASTSSAANMDLDFLSK